MALAAGRIGQDHTVKSVSLQSPRWSFSRYAPALVSRMAKYSNLKGLEQFHAFVLQRSQHQRLKEIIRKHHLTHLLNLGVFDQSFPEVDIPVWGIVYDTNYAPSWRDKCLNNLSCWSKRADGILAISNWTQEQIIKAVPCSKDKIHTVPLAVTAPQPCILHQVEHDNSRPVLLYPASFKHHKNHFFLLKTLALLDKEGYDFKMIFCGLNTDQIFSSHRLDDKILEMTRAFVEASSSRFKARIHALGMVDRRQLERLFEQASHVLLPSTYEGFGLPLAEAVARGVPVLCSDIAPFREQVSLYGLDRHVIIINRFDEDLWTQAIKRAADQANHPDQCRKSISECLNKWTWSDVASQYLKLRKHCSFNRSLAKR
jgi:glycosyltransferase involved in cell wall biosynthesis